MLDYNIMNSKHFVLIALLILYLVINKIELTSKVIILIIMGVYILDNWKYLFLTEYKEKFEVNGTVDATALSQLASVLNTGDLVTTNTNVTGTATINNLVLDPIKTLDLLPIGIIIGWKGATLPSDKWAVCNGENGTTNLYSYPIRGAPELNMNGTELPPQGSITMSTTPDHLHNVGVIKRFGSIGDGNRKVFSWGGWGTTTDHSSAGDGITSGVSGGHSHTIDGVINANVFKPRTVLLTFIIKIA